MSAYHGFRLPGRYDVRQADDAVRAGGRLLGVAVLGSGQVWQVRVDRTAPTQYLASRADAEQLLTQAYPGLVWR